MSPADFGFRFDALPILIVVLYGLGWGISALIKSSRDRAHDRKVEQAERAFKERKAREPA